MVDVHSSRRNDQICRRYPEIGRRFALPYISGEKLGRRWGVWKGMDGWKQWIPKVKEVGRGLIETFFSKFHLEQPEVVGTGDIVSFPLLLLVPLSRLARLKYLCASFPEPTGEPFQWGPYACIRYLPGTVTSCNQHKYLHYRKIKTVSSTRTSRSTC